MADSGHIDADRLPVLDGRTKVARRARARAREIEDGLSLPATAAERVLIRAAATKSVLLELRGDALLAAAGGVRGDEVDRVLAVSKSLQKDLTLLTDMQQSRQLRPDLENLTDEQLDAEIAQLERDLAQMSDTELSQLYFDKCGQQGHRSPPTQRRKGMQ